ncbi:hypothetical protein TgHK011_009118 [Trichoderma gracile]|nr:hypothetical protein TgHK011_009118 [Trichoderma gracile]
MTRTSCPIRHWPAGPSQPTRIAPGIAFTIFRLVSPGGVWATVDKGPSTGTDGVRRHDKTTQARRRGTALVARRTGGRLLPGERCIIIISTSTSTSTIAHCRPSRAATRPRRASPVLVQLQLCTGKQVVVECSALSSSTATPNSSQVMLEDFHRFRAQLEPGDAINAQELLAQLSLPIDQWSCFPNGSMYLETGALRLA